MKITKAKFYEMTEVLWHELEHQNGLDRVQDERGARDIPGFMTLADCYVRRVQAWWVIGNTDPALSELRKLTAVCVSAMIHCGVCDRARPDIADDERVKAIRRHM